MATPRIDVKSRLERYRPVSLQPGLEDLTADERSLLPHLFRAAECMHRPYCAQEYGDLAALLATVDDDDAGRLIEINCSPWDREFGYEPIIHEVPNKPDGANYYPADISKPEFEAAAASNSLLGHPYTMVRRGDGGELLAIPYHTYFSHDVRSSSEHLRRAAEISKQPQFKRFLVERSAALVSDDYRESDMSWVDLEQGNLDLLIGPTEIEDRLFGLKAAYTGTVFVRQQRLERELLDLRTHLPAMQAALPLPDSARSLPARSIGDIRVYDMAYAAGLDRCVTPTGVAWPNDEIVQSLKGIRSMLISNLLQAKYEYLLQPLADLLVGSSQQRHATAAGRMQFVMLHEVAHGLGVNTVEDSGEPVRDHLKELHHAMEEAKANLAALWSAVWLAEAGLMDRQDLLAQYVMSLVSQLYNGGSRQSSLQLNWFIKAGAYEREADGGYLVQPDKFPAVVEELLRKVLDIQWKGDYAEAGKLFEAFGQPDETLQNDLRRYDEAELPIAVYIADPLTS